MDNSSDAIVNRSQAAQLVSHIRLKVVGTIPAQFARLGIGVADPRPKTAHSLLAIPELKRQFSAQCFQINFRQFGGDILKPGFMPFGRKKRIMNGFVGNDQAKRTFPWLIKKIHTPLSDQIRQIPRRLLLDAIDVYDRINELTLPFETNPVVEPRSATVIEAHVPFANVGRLVASLFTE